MGCPRTSVSTTENICPGAVTAATASSYDMTIGGCSPQLTKRSDRRPGRTEITEAEVACSDFTFAPTL